MPVLPKDISDEDFKKWVAEKWGHTKLPMAGSTPAGSAKFFRTGDWASKRPILDSEKCTSCLNCYFFCPDNAITMKPNEAKGGKKQPEFDYFYCKGCGVCANDCKFDAIKMEDL